MDDPKLYGLYNIRPGNYRPVRMVCLVCGIARKRCASDFCPSCEVNGVQPWDAMGMGKFQLQVDI